MRPSRRSPASGSSRRSARSSRPGRHARERVERLALEPARGEERLDRALREPAEGDELAARASPSTPSIAVDHVVSHRAEVAAFVGDPEGEHVVAGEALEHLQVVTSGLTVDERVHAPAQLDARRLAE